jgi:hypothetical protein
MKEISGQVRDGKDKMANLKRRWAIRLFAVATFCFVIYPNAALPAEWWQGLFSPYNPESSAAVPSVDGTWNQAERYRQQCLSPGADDYPLFIGSDSLDGYEHGCSITKRTNVQTLDAIILDLECSSEGTEFQTRAILMQTDERSGLAIYPGRRVATGWTEEKPRQIVQLYRCPADAPRTRRYD